MASRRPRTVLYRRRRTQKTDYQKRLRLLKSDCPRLVVRLTNTKIISQVVQFEMNGDQVLVGKDSSGLKDFGWKYSYKNYPAAYLLGLLLGKETLKKGIKKVILDTGSDCPLKKSRTYSLLKGVVDSGVEVPCSSEDIFPDADTISGKHIAEYALSLKKDKKAYDLKFSDYEKNNSSPEKIVEAFNTAKHKIMGNK